MGREEISQSNENNWLALLTFEKVAIEYNSVPDGSANLSEVLMILEAPANKFAELAYGMKDCPVSQRPVRYRLMALSRELDAFIAEVESFLRSRWLFSISPFPLDGRLHAGLYISSS